MNRVSQEIQKLGFLKMAEGKNRESFNLGYTVKGFSEKVFHLHLRLSGDNNELYFRDYLNENRQVAKEYETLKLYLWKKYEHDRDAYTNAKWEFVMKYTSLAKKQYGNRYSE